MLLNWEKKLPMKLKILNQKLLVACCLLLVALVGGFLRFYNLNWDQGHFFHPDERNIAMAVSRIHFFDQLNPQFFAYGSLPIYLYRAIGDFLVILTKDPTWVSDWSYINLIGRSTSAFFATLSIFLIFFLGKKIGNARVGLLAAFLTAFTVALIQTAHYGTTESLLVFWLLLLAIFSFEITEKPTLKTYMKVGVVLGLAAATKVSALSFLIIPFSAHFLYYFRSWKNHLKLLISLLTALFTLAVFSPYVFLSFQKFTESMKYESGVATGSLKVVYVLQFDKTWPYLFQIKNFFWQMGPMTALGIFGMLLLLAQTIRTKNKKLFIFLSFPVAYFLYVGSWHTKFIRYMVPVLPFLSLTASWFIWELWKKSKVFGSIILTLTLTLTFFWSSAFFSIYTREQTRITASRWIYQNIPQGAEILTEHWDDGLPIDLPPNFPNQYPTEQLTIYEPDNYQKINYYSQKLSQADYIVINSRRLYGTLVNLPEKYPITGRYYQLLFTGQLGYQKIAEFTSYPSLLGVAINDDTSEETFQVYDHPKVMIFKNQKRLTQNDLLQILK